MTKSLHLMLGEMSTPLRTVEAVAGLLGHLSTADCVIQPEHLDPLFEALHDAGAALREALGQAEALVKGDG